MNEIVNHYAEALLSIAREDSQLQNYQLEVKELRKIIKDNPDFIILIDSKFLPMQERKDEVDKLFKKRHIDLLVEDAKVKAFNDKETTIEITLGDEYIKIRGIGNILFEALIPYLQILKISYAKNVFRLRFNKRKQWVDDLIDVLKSLANIISKNVVKEKV